MERTPPTPPSKHIYTLLEFNVIQYTDILRTFWSVSSVWSVLYSDFISTLSANPIFSEEIKKINMRINLQDIQIQYGTKQFSSELWTRTVAGNIISWLIVHCLRLVSEYFTHIDYVRNRWLWKAAKYTSLLGACCFWADWHHFLCHTFNYGFITSVSISSNEGPPRLNPSYEKQLKFPVYVF